MSNTTVLPNEYPTTVSVTENKTFVEVQELSNRVTVSEDTLTAYVSLIGTQGPRGGTILYGMGDPPADLGNHGDIYIDQDAPASFWGPKDETTGWPTEPFFTFTTSQRFVYEQAVPSSTWAFSHPLGGFPSISVVDSAKTQVIGEVTYVSETDVIIEFGSPFAGFAFLT